MRMEKKLKVIFKKIGEGNVGERRETIKNFFLPSILLNQPIYISI